MLDKKIIVLLIGNKPSEIPSDLKDSQYCQAGTLWRAVGGDRAAVKWFDAQVSRLRWELRYA
jgi:hypothetical protein